MKQVTVRKMVADRAALMALINKYKRSGYVVVEQAELSARLIGDKRPSILLSALLFALGVVPGLIYQSIAKRTETVEISVKG